MANAITEATDRSNLMARLFRSVRRRGIVATLGVARRRVMIPAVRRFDRCIDFVKDLINGTETARIIETPNLIVTSVHKAHGVRYQPTHSRPFRRLIGALCLSPGEVFVDVGSGKGRVLMMASELGFKKIIGVEYAEDLCGIARRNLAAARLHKPLATQAVIHCCDAVEYDFNEGETVIYMNNPFDSVVLVKVLQNLVESLRQAPRNAWLIYQGARFFSGPSSLQSVIESHGMFTNAGVYDYGGWEFAVFTHNPKRVSNVCSG